MSVTGLQRAGPAGLGVAAVQVQRVDGVVGGELLAVRELDALAEVENPVLGAVLRLPALGQIWMRPAVLAPFDDAVEQAMADVDHHGVVVRGDVDAVGRAAAAEAEPQRAAVLRRLCGERVGARQHGGNREARGAERSGAAHELAPRDRAAKQPAVPVVQFIHLRFSQFEAGVGFGRYQRHRVSPRRQS